MQHACAFPPEGDTPATRIALVLGIGNSLMADDGAGVQALSLLARHGRTPNVHYVDGGTVGLALAPLIEDAGALIILDALRLGGPAGKVRVYEGAEMDRLVQGRHGTPHEVSLGDLLDVVRLQGRLPERRALVGIEPEHLGLGLELSPCVAAGLERVAMAARALLARWGVVASASAPAVNPSP